MKPRVAARVVMVPALLLPLCAAVALVLPLPGMADVFIGWPTHSPHIDGRLRASYHAIYNDLYAHPEHYVGIYHTGHGITVQVPRGASPAMRARLDDDLGVMVRGVEVVASNRSTAATLMHLQDEPFDAIPGACGAGIDWRRHQVVVSTTDVFFDARRLAKRMYGDDIILERSPCDARAL